jgi:H/ACA ribonucleoprotein complex non-core subunit NAF1
MDSRTGFKLPSALPQDLLLINELIGPISPLSTYPKPEPQSPHPDDSDIASSNGEGDSEEEVEAGLLDAELVFDSDESEQVHFIYTQTLAI